MFPFDSEITYSEDVEWSYRMKRSGRTITYVKDAVVEHSHNYSLKEVRKRFHGEGVAEAKIFGFKPSILQQFIKPFISESLRDVIYLIKNGEIAHIPYGIIYRALQKYSVYKGIRDYSVLGSER
jgi:rhamnosyltransferase